MKLWLLHPMAVHFPVALLFTGFALHARGLWKGGGDWTALAGRWLLWLGTAGAWVTLGLGLVAERTAPHVPSAWEILARHEELAWWTCWLFTGASSVAGWIHMKTDPAPRWGRTILFGLWLGGLGLLAYTADIGGQLVFEHNMGTAASEE